MVFVRPIVLAVLLALIALGGNTKAEKLAKDAGAAEKAGETVRAYLLWAEAAAADRTNPAYWARAEALRPRAETQSDKRLPNPELKMLPKEPAVGSPVTGSFTAQDLEDLNRMSPPPRLRPSALVKTFHLRANARSLFEQVSNEFGYTVIFDKDYAPSGDIRFELSDVGYIEALHTLEAATDTFIVPIADTTLLVAADNPQKRTELEFDEALAIPIPERSSVQEAQELLTLVQQAFEVRRAALDPQRRMILLRDRVSKVEAALSVLNQLSIGKPQVSIEMEFLSTNASSSLSLGMTLPSQFPLVDFGRVLHSAPAIPAGFMRFLTFGGGASFVGLGLTSAQMFATASRSSATSLLRSTLITSDGQAATFHVGNKYPIITSGYLGSQGFSNSGTGGTTNVTYAVISTTPYASDMISSAVSTTGKMNLVVNSTVVPFTLPTIVNNLVGLESVINSLGTGVYASAIERGTNAKPISLVLAGGSLAITSIQLIDDPDGAKIDLMKLPDVVSAISGDFVNATQTKVSKTGDLSLTVGTKTFPLVLDSATNNLNGLRDAINAASAGVTASVLVSNLAGGTVFLQVVASAAGSGAIELYDDPTGAKTTLLTATDQVNNVGSQLGQTVSGTTSNSTSNIGQVYTPPPTFNFEDLGLILKVTPTVHNPEEVTLEIEAEFKMLGTGSYNGIPVIANRKFQGKVRLKTSEWAVVTGLMSDAKSESAGGIPGLKDIPGLGLVFRDNEKTHDEESVLIVIKPSVTTLPASEYLGRSIWVGSETKPLSPL